MIDYENENENAQTQDHTDDIEDNYIQANHYHICKKPNFMNIKNQKIETNKSKISEDNSNENEKIYIDDKTESNKSNIPERGIPLNIKEINDSYFINKLKKKYVNKKDHKQNKRKAYNQYKSPNNQYNININNFSPFQMNQMNIQGQNYNSNNYMNNNFMQNNQNMNNNNQMRFNNYGMNNNNVNMNNFNQNIPPQQNMASMQQMMYSMRNMNLNRNINNQNRNNINMMNNMNNSNNMQNQNQNQNLGINGINLPYANFMRIDNPNNQKEVKFIEITREKTENGQKVKKVEYKIKYVKNDNKKMNKK